MFIKSLSNNFEVFVVTNLNQLSKDEINNYKKNIILNYYIYPLKEK